MAQDKGTGQPDASPIGAGKPKVDVESADRIAVDISLAEYKSLRDEILKKMDNRTALIVSSITVSSAIIGFGVERMSGPLLLVAPLVSVLLGLLVVHHNLQIGELSMYVRDEIETGLAKRYPASIGWHGGRTKFRVQFRHRVLSYHLPLILITVAPAMVSFALAWPHRDPLALTIPLGATSLLLLVVYVRHIICYRDRI